MLSIYFKSIAQIVDIVFGENQEEVGMHVQVFSILGKSEIFSQTK